jgi:hypothetical protein
MTRRRLVVAKQLYQEAIVSAAVESAVGRMLAIISLDMAAETLVKTVILSANPRERTDRKNFQELVSEADRLAQSQGVGALPYKTEVLSCRSVRNAVQHDARVPSAGDVEQARIYTLSFLDSSTQLLWGIHLTDVSLADLVSDPKLRDYLVASESALASGDHVLSIFRASYALDVSLWGLASATFVTMSGHEEMVSPSTHELVDAVVLSMAGINLARYRRLRTMAGSAAAMLGGGARFSGFDLTAGRADAECAVAFCTDAILRIQEQMGMVVSHNSSSPGAEASLTERQLSGQEEWHPSADEPISSNG